MTTIYNTVKLIVLGLVLIGLVVGGLKAYAWIDMKFTHQEEKHAAELEAARQYKEYSENLVRAHTEIGSLKNEIKALKDGESRARTEMLKDIEERDETIKNMGETVAKLNENIRDLRVKSDHEYKRDTGDYNEQYFKKIMYRAKDEDGNVLEVPVGWAMFFPNREPEKQWKTGVYPLEYHTRTIQSEQQDGQWNTYSEVWFENNKDKASRGIEVPIKIASSEFKQERVEGERMYWWAPKLNLNADIYGSTDLEAGGAAGLSLSLMGYGRTENDLSWQFVDFGVSTSGDDTYFKFTPIKYNIGRNLPLIDNSFIGPFIGFSTGGDTVFGFSISIPF
jgi:hypothetical protein